MQLPSLDVCKISANHPSPIPIFSGFRPFTQADAIPPRNHRKNLVSCKRNRFQAINSSNPEKEAQISREKEDVGNGGGGSPSTSFLSLLCPLLKLFSAGDPSKERNFLLEEATSSLSTLARFPWGSRSLSDVLNDQQKVNLPLRLQLFEFEACPFCRRVREAITELDLSVEIFPCPKGSMRHREMVRKLGGREQFPFLVDPNTGISMYESSDIVKYLFRQYGGERSPSFGILERIMRASGIFFYNRSIHLHTCMFRYLLNYLLFIPRKSTLLTGWMPTLLRAGRGMTLWKNSAKEPPPEKLELFSFENNPYARIVREVLCELELPYILQSVGQGSRRAQLLLELSGSYKVPYLVDPNTGMETGEYKKIMAYLVRTYSIAST
ncbi:uncharacterized protein [Henckelia pumila]|uniref:uncharacterized protein isoform X1 n=1 Tax=Henckelia pumila TaxID=405737 RepID=UPI003C6DE072